MSPLSQAKESASGLHAGELEAKLQAAVATSPPPKPRFAMSEAEYAAHQAKEKKNAFAARRAAHYDEYKKVQAMKERLARGDAEDADEEAASTGGGGRGDVGAAYDSSRV